MKMTERCSCFGVIANDLSLVLFEVLCSMNGEPNDELVHPSALPPPVLSRETHV